MITRRHRTALGDSISDYLQNAFNGGRLTSSQIQTIAQQTAQQVLQAGGSPQAAQAAAAEVTRYANGVANSQPGFDVTQIPAAVEGAVSNALAYAANVAGSIAGAAKSGFDNGGAAATGVIAAFTGLNLLLLAAGAGALYWVLKD